MFRAKILPHAGKPMNLCKTDEHMQGQHSATTHTNKNVSGVFTVKPQASRKTLIICFCSVCLNPKFIRKERTGF